jgi:hypothetical protein
MLPSDIFLFVLKDAEYKLTAVNETALFVATNYFKGKASYKTISKCSFRNVQSPKSSL